MPVSGYPRSNRGNQPVPKVRIRCIQITVQSVNLTGKKPANLRLWNRGWHLIEAQLDKLHPGVVVRPEI
ncbi:MAG TPA: hypothetical protein VF813_00910, partial [Anaerolineaceae bacterium]